MESFINFTQNNVTDSKRQRDISIIEESNELDMHRSTTGTTTQFSPHCHKFPFKSVIFVLNTKQQTSEYHHMRSSFLNDTRI